MSEKIPITSQTPGLGDHQHLVSEMQEKLEQAKEKSAGEKEIIVIPDRRERVLEPSEMFNEAEAKLYIEGCDFPETSDYIIPAVWLDNEFGVRGKTILEICTGPGNLALEISRLGAEKVIGLDGDPTMINHAQQKQNLTQGLKFQLGLVDNVPFNDNSFDLTIVQNSLHQLFNPLNAIKEMVRVLKSGGIGVIRDFNRLCSEKNLIERLEHTKPGIVELLLDSILAAQTPEEFAEMLNKIQDIASFEIRNVPDPRGSSPKVDELIALDPVPHWMDHLISHDVIFIKK